MGLIMPTAAGERACISTTLPLLLLTEPPRLVLLCRLLTALLPALPGCAPYVPCRPYVLPAVDSTAALCRRELGSVVIVEARGAERLGAKEERKDAVLARAISHQPAGNYGVKQR
jgi:hypothetical protein